MAPCALPFGVDCWRLRRAANFVAREVATDGEVAVRTAVLAFQPAGADGEPTEDRRMAEGLCDIDDSGARGRGRDRRVCADHCDC